MIYDVIKKMAKEQNISINRLEIDLNLSSSSISKWNNSTPNAVALSKVAKY